MTAAANPVGSDQGRSAPTQVYKLVVGLGNPGPRYSGTRHNAGFLVLDELARRHAGSFKQAQGAASAKLSPGTLAPTSVTLLKPLTFMNLSGRAVQGAMTRSGVRPAELIVVHDDIDLPLGRLRVKHGGGSGGQRGVADISRAIGSEYVRVKVGVGRPPSGWSTENWVLSRFAQEEAALLAEVVSSAADAVELLTRHGLERAMNEINGRDHSVGGGPSTETA